MKRQARKAYVKKAQNQTFQRRSQQNDAVDTASDSNRLVWVAAVFLSLGLLGGYFVVHHFVTEGVGSEKTQVERSAEQAEKPVEPQPVIESVVEDKAIEPIQAPPATQSKSVSYTFYDGLSQTEVVVDEVPLSVTLPVPYYIQAGTFGRREVALKEQARLKKLGEEVDLTVLKQTKTYYRLRVGPFTDRLEMNKKRNALRRLGVDTLLIRTRPKS